MDLNFLKDKEPKSKNAKDKNGNKSFFDFSKKVDFDSADLKRSRKQVLNEIKNGDNTDKNEIKDTKSKTKKSDGLSFWQKMFIKPKGKRKDFYKSKDDLNSDKGEEVPKHDIKKEVVTEKKTEKWERVDMLNTNLIKGELYIDFDWQRNIVYLIIGILISSIMLSGAYFSLSFIEEGNKVEIGDYRDEINEIKSKVVEAEIEIEKIKIIGEKIRIVKEVLDNHIYWTNFFKFLEDNTLPNVYYSNFSGTADGLYNFSAKTDDFDSLYAQILHFDNTKDVFDATTNSGDRITDPETGNSEVNFGISLTINPNIFYQ